MAIKGTDVYGNVSVGRNVAAGGNARVNGNIRVGHNLKVEGWLEAPNIKDVNKGVFRTLAELQAAYPDPKVGWFAGVGVSTPFAAYEAVDGDWVATGGTIDVNVDLAHYDSLLDDHGEAIGNLESGMVNAERNIDLLSVLSRSGYRIGGFIGPNNSYLAKAVEGSCYVGMAYGSASWADGVSGRVWLPPTGWTPQGESVKPSSVSGWTSVDLSSPAYNGYVVLFGFRDGKWVVHRLPYALKEKVDSLAGIWDTYVGRISENESGIRRIEELLTNYNTYLSSAVRFSGDKTVVRAGEESQVNFTFDTDLDFEGTATLELYADGLLVGTYTIESADQLPYTFSRDVDGSCLFTLRAHIGAQEFMSVWHVSAGHDFYVGAGPDYSSVLSDASARRSGDTDMGGTYSLFAMEGDRVYVICPVTDVVSDVKMSGFLFPMELEQTVYVEGVRYAVYRSANTMQRGEIDITINDVEFDKGGFITHLIAKMQDVVDASIGTEEMIKSIADEETITVNDNNKVALKNRPMKRNLDTNEVIQKGYVILRETDDFRDVVESYTDGHVIFEIDYAFDLSGTEVTIPEGCTLKFDGGSLSNGTLVGNNIKLRWDSPFLYNNITLQGRFTTEVVVRDSDIFIEESFDNKRIANLFNIYGKDNLILFRKGIYNNVETINLERNIDVDFNGSIINLHLDNSGLPNSFLFMEERSLNDNSVLNKVCVRNVTIVGNPEYRNNPSSAQGTNYHSGLRRRCIQLFKVDNVLFDNVHLAYIENGTTPSVSKTIRNVYEYYVVSVFYYNNAIVTRCSEHDCKGSGIFKFVPNNNANHLSVFYNKAYDTYNTFLEGVDCCCDVHDNVLNNFYSSALNLFCYNSTIYNNAFTNCKTFCIDLNEGYYHANNVNVYNNSCENVYNFCRVNGLNVTVKDNMVSLTKDENGKPGTAIVFPLVDKTVNGDNVNNLNVADNNIIIDGNIVDGGNLCAVNYATGRQVDGDNYCYDLIVVRNNKVNIPETPIAAQYSPIWIVNTKDLFIDNNIIKGVGRNQLSGTIRTIMAFALYANTTINSALNIKNNLFEADSTLTAVDCLTMQTNAASAPNVSAKVFFTNNTCARTMLVRQANFETGTVTVVVNNDYNLTNQIVSNE